MGGKECWGGIAVRPGDVALARDIEGNLVRYERAEGALIGVRPAENRAAFVEQLVESLRREGYVAALQRKRLSPQRGNPGSDLFDPLMAAILARDGGNHDEACWLVFLSVHFGKHLRDGWRLSRDVYGRIGQPGLWTWRNVAADPEQFSGWISDNFATLSGGDGVRRRFGNHRKYETLRPESGRSTGNVVATYVRWVLSVGTHRELFDHHCALADGEPKGAFDRLYVSLNPVLSFGRTARFDYLTMIAKLRLADIQPGVAYLHGATGPLRGARLLVGGRTTAALDADLLEERLVALDGYLGVGMQALEDSLCNWQKSPGRFVGFRG